MREWIRLSRRRLLTASSQLALMLSLPVLESCEKPQEQQPWSDGTFFSDGTGWIE